ncbi:Transcriptional activator protein CopR [uncultured Desulfatiglans sp.]|nr:Transcriptional activator protein CopR [uncultured Desulfatiglans sp.]
MRILIVEDDLKISAFVKKGLEHAGFAVDHAGNGEDGLDMASTGVYDALVVDIMLPKRNGLSLIQTLRQEKINTPVLILSAKDSVDDKVEGLQLGGDDYLTKPFAFAELLSRLQALIRRAGGFAEPARLTVGDLTLDIYKHEVMRGGDHVILQPLEFSLLEYLMRNKGRVVSKTMIMEHVWDYNFDPFSNVVETRIYKLREKIDKDYNPKLIHTIRGVGYVIKENV